MFWPPIPVLLPTWICFTEPKLGRFSNIVMDAQQCQCLCIAHGKLSILFLKATVIVSITGGNFNTLILNYCCLFIANLEHNCREIPIAFPILDSTYLLTISSMVRYRIRHMMLTVLGRNPQFVCPLPIVWYQLVYQGLSFLFKQVQKASR